MLYKTNVMSVVNYFKATAIWTDEAQSSNSKSKRYRRLLMVKGEKYLKTTVIPRTFREHCLELLKTTKQQKTDYNFVQVSSTLRKQNQIRMKAQKLQEKKGRHFFDIQITEAQM